MVYCAVVGCYNHSNKTNTTEKISYFHVPSDESLHRIWLSICPLKFCLRLFYSMVLMYTGILSRILLKFLVIFSHILKNQEQLFSRTPFSGSETSEKLQSKSVDWFQYDASFY